MTIAIANEDLFGPLLRNIDAACASRGIALRRCSLEECGELLLASMVDAALVSPLGYGSGVGRVDYRIVGGPCLALQDYTHVFGADFTPGAADLLTYQPESKAAGGQGSFMSTIMHMTLSEKFDVELRPAQAGETADCVFGAPPSSAMQSLDLGEEWFDLAEAPLPIAIWTIRVDSEIENFDALVADAADAALQQRPVSELVPVTSEHAPREGAILYRWSDSVEEGLVATLNALYFRQLLPEIPAVKLYGRD
ncbi:MAG: hypothetical protein FGM33_02475 [Candidatus Kapabacteria bacterium]|nr:hypothetical protein [Candidatus Kapabacteria bacterium]